MPLITQLPVAVWLSARRRTTGEERLCGMLTRAPSPNDRSSG